MVMALASPDAEPVPDFRIGQPEHSRFTNNLLGRFSPLGPRRPERVQRLGSYGINAVSFNEYIPGTRFALHPVNIRYSRAVRNL